MLSRTQNDRLGDRLRRGPVSPADVRLLDERRRSFGEADKTVVQAIRERLQLERTGGPSWLTARRRKDAGAHSEGISRRTT
jgi:hypothetical protein